ncbi:DNA-directed RNA polymerase subunit omega [Virgibacillus sp. MSP4-1]|uniref:DNA-directed RNA polymerase subunit omega n=1 Tax=Virgibacillus sp. MSP4-1 TaxID=2700081 RepID=UPI0003A2D5E8|nr:DNA-directed RNA polymerase subunit omega [Virgibacillus sp. MSP4-1]QHS22195.1 DNA-directed RNA polymerase subunit omega [Virgibacillus sp. MSP4-1]
MMLEPSVDELLEKINSKYALVILSAKRARELQFTDDPMIEEVKSNKLVGTALEEIRAEKLETANHDYE